MGARFLSASSTCIANSSPTVTGIGFVVGLWVFIIDTVAAALMGLTSSTSTTDFINLVIAVTPTIGFSSDAAGTNRLLVSAIVPVVGKWYFVMGRSISSTNRWVIVFDPSTGLVDQVQSTLSSSPTFTTPRFFIGGRPSTSVVNPSNDIIAEAWYTDADFLGSGGVALQAEFVRKLALEGPFSRPEISDNIVEYRSLMLGVDNAVQADSNSYSLVYSRIGLTTWNNPFTASAVPITAPHPPLSPNYIRPGQVAPILVI